MMMRQKTMRRQKATMMLKMWRWKLGTQKKVHAQNVQLGPPILRKKTLESVPETASICDF
jgi:hypothetical protein